MSGTDRAVQRVPIAALVLLGVAAALRAGHFIDGLDDPYVQFRVGDELHYHKWAGAIAGGELARDAPFFTTPLYAYVLGLAYRLAGDAIWVPRLLNTALGVGSVALVYLASRQLLERTAALTAAAIYGLCLTPIFYETFAEKTTLVLFLTAAAFYLALRAERLASAPAWLATGLAVGIAATAHSLLLALVPAALAQIAVSPRAGPPRRRALAAGALVAGAALAIAPVTAHNWLRGDAAVIIGSNAGVTFHVGNHRGNLTGLYTSPPFSIADLSSEEHRYREEAQRRTGREMRPSEVSRFWLHEAWRDIRAQPQLALERFLRKLRWSIGAEELSDTRTLEFYAERMAALKLPLWHFGTAATLGLVGWVMLAGRREWALVVVFVPVFCVAIAAFFVYGRYRLPLLVPFAMLAGALVVRVMELGRAHRMLPAALLLAGCVATGTLVYTPPLPSMRVSFLPDYYNQGNRFLERGRLDLAAAEYEKALSVRPGDHPAVPLIAVGLADLYAREGQLGRAVAILESVAQRHPDQRAITERLERYRRGAAR